MQNTLKFIQCYCSPMFINLMHFLKSNFLILFFCWLGFISLDTAEKKENSTVFIYQAWAHIRALIVPIKSRQRYMARLVFMRNTFFYGRTIQIHTKYIGWLYKTQCLLWWPYTKCCRSFREFCAQNLLYLHILKRRQTVKNDFLFEIASNHRNRQNK